MVNLITNVALAEVPVNQVPLTSDVDFKTVNTTLAYSAVTLWWVFTDILGNTTVTSVTPTSGGVYDWAHQAGGMFTIEIPKSGGASINNDKVGVGYFIGQATGVLPWRGPDIFFVLGGAITGGSPSTIKCICTDLPSTVNDQHKEAYIKFLSGAAKDAPRKVTAFDFTTSELTFDALPTAPSVGDPFVLIS